MTLLFRGNIYKTVLCLCCLWLVCAPLATAEDTKSTVQNYVDDLKATYENLPPAGKFGTGLAAAFVTTRTAVRTAVGAAKIAGATYIA